MIIDARTLHPGSTIKADICIIGCGVVGVTLAREFAGTDLTVAILESGGLEYEQQTQDLYHGECVSDSGHIEQRLSGTRYRQMGGTAVRWNVSLGRQGRGARYLPLADVDFERREHIPHSGWPISRHDLDPYYERAHALCGLGPYKYGAADWARPGSQPLPIRSSHVETAMFQFGGRKPFTRSFREFVRNEPNVVVYLHANLTELHTNDAGTAVESAGISSLEGKQHAVYAQTFVLAAGGIENARILLASERGRRFGLGNEYDLVGRYFMDHPIIRGGEFFPASQQLFAQTALYDLRRVRHSWIMGHLVFSQELLRSTDMLNTSMLLFPRRPNFYERQGVSAREQQAICSARYLGRSLVYRQKPRDTLSHLATIGVGLTGVVKAAQQRYAGDEPSFDKGGWSLLAHPERRYTSFEVFHQTEQTPDYHSRVMLDRENDALGIPRARLAWRWSQRDIGGVRQAQQKFAATLAQSGLGEYVVADCEGLPHFIGGTHHHMGTTRMDRDAALGVVDANSCVHGIGNLFVGGSSVFPTGGYANPTLTIVALAVRLADHLKQRLDRTLELSPVSVAVTSGEPRKAMVLPALRARFQR